MFALAVIAGPPLMKVYRNPAEFDLQFNGYALVSLTSLIVNLTVLFMLMRTKQRTESSVWFGFFVGCIAFFATGEMFQRMSVHPGGALFWAQFSAIGLILGPLALYAFSASYSGRLRSKMPLIPLFIIAACVVVFFNASGNLFFNTDPAAMEYFSWGFNNSIGPGFIFHLGWIAGLYTVSVYMLYRMYRKTQERLLRQQALLFTLAVSAPWVTGTINDGILPLFGISMVPVAVSMATLTGVLILYGFKRYQLFKIDQELLSNSILATMKEAVIVTRPDFTIDRLNDEAAYLLDQPKKSLYRKSLRQFFPDTAWDSITTNYLNVPRQAGANAGYQTRVLSNRTPVRVMVSELQEFGAAVGYVFVISDITELAESLERLATEKQNVEHIVEVRTQALRKAHEDLKAADQLKTEFIVLSSHNLRTPLAALMAGIDLLQATKLPPAMQKATIASLGESIQSLSHLVDNILTISQLEAGDQLILKPEETHTIFDTLLDEARRTAKAKKLEFTADIDAPAGVLINCNILRLQNAFRSILDNAFKFTKNGSVSLSICVRQGKMQVIVKDSGIGISDQEIAKLFTKFHRGTDTYQFNYQGEGIGLYFTKLVIEEHGGTIGVVSKLKQGTTVTVDLPVINESTRSSEF